MPTVMSNTDQYYLVKAEQEHKRVHEIAKMLEPKIKELMPEEKATYRIAAAMAESMKTGSIKSMEVYHSPHECCDIVTFKLHN
jgi:6-pyruvoyl-tetrahydropterin synthase